MARNLPLANVSAVADAFAVTAFPPTIPAFSCSSSSSSLSASGVLSSTISPEAAVPEITKPVSMETSVAASEATAVADQPVECAVTPAEVSQGQENGDVLAEVAKVAEQVPEASVIAEEPPSSDVKPEQATEETAAPAVAEQVTVANEVSAPQESEAAIKEDSVAMEEVSATEEIKEAAQETAAQEAATEELKEAAQEPAAQEPATEELKEAAQEPATEELKMTAAEESPIQVPEEPVQDKEPEKDLSAPEATEPVSAPVAEEPAEEPAEVDGPAPKSVDSETLSENFKAVSLNPAPEADLTTKLEQPPTVTIDIATQNGTPLNKAEPVTIFSQAVQAKAEPNCAGPSLTSRHLSGG